MVAKMKTSLSAHKQPTNTSGSPLPTSTNMKKACLRGLEIGQRSSCTSLSLTFPAPLEKSKRLTCQVQLLTRMLRLRIDQRLKEGQSKWWYPKRPKWTLSVSVIIVLTRLFCSNWIEEQKEDSWSWPLQDGGIVQESYTSSPKFENEASLTQNRLIRIIYLQRYNKERKLLIFVWKCF